MMLIAKYATVFHGIDTPFSLLGLRFPVGLRPLHPKGMGAIFGPLVLPRHIGRGILRIINTLGALRTPTVTTPYMTAFLGLARLWTFCPVLGKLFPRLTAEGQKDS